MGYERLIRQADQIPFEGWDFGVFRGRFVEAEPFWEFSKLLRTLHATMESGAPLKINGHRFLVIAPSARRASDLIRCRQDCTKVQAKNRPPARCASLLLVARC